MIDGWLDSVLYGDWTIATFRIAFVGVVYLFLYVVLRATVRELAEAARTMSVADGQASQASLQVLDAAGSSLRPGQELVLRERTRIGRDVGSELVIDDPYVSARHAELLLERGQWWLRDLGSSNGTLLNDEPVRSVVVVRHGDVLQCGRVGFRFVSSIVVP